MNPSSRRKTFLDFFPVPNFLLFSSTGIAISDKDTKFVQLKRETFGDKAELVHATKVANPKGAVEAGLISKVAEIVPILKNLASHYGIQYAYATLPEERAYIFTTTIDWVSPEGLKDAVAFIIEENAPVTLAESVFDFKIINEDKVALKIKLVVTVLSKKVVSSYMDLFESAGITPVSFELESQAITRTAIRHDDNRPHLIINLSWKKTGFYIVEERIVRFSTVSTYSVSDDDSYPSLNDLKAEMRKVLAFWNVHADNTGKSENKIEKIVLCGPGARKKDFVEKLMSESEIEYSLVDIWLNLSSRHHFSKMTFDESISYISAVGSVLPHNR